MKCPACDEINDAEMMFCINCGHSLAPVAPAPPPPAPAVKADEMQAQGQRPLPGSAVLLICTICNKTDPLNGQFCVYCGGRTVAASGASSAAAGVPAGANQQGLATAAGAYSTEDAPPAAFNRDKPGAKNSAGLLAVLLAVLAGAALSLAICYKGRDYIARFALDSSWPKEGILLFSDSPGSEFRLENLKNDSLIVGKTSTDGTLSVQAVSPGGYMLHLADNKSDRTLSTKLEVKANELNLIGYPSRLEAR